MNKSHSRLWETRHLDAALFDEPSKPSDREVALAAAVTIVDDGAGFAIANASDTDASVLITLMAKAKGSDLVEAREALLRLTSAAANPEPLRVPAEGHPLPYAHLWHDDVAVRRRSHGGFVASRSGTVVVPVPAGGSFALGTSPIARENGVVVAMIAGIRAGLDTAAPLTAIDRGASASIGDRPRPPQ